MHGVHGSVSNVQQWNLLSAFNVENPFFIIPRSLCIATWVVLFFIGITIILCRFLVTQPPKSTPRFIILFCTRSFMNFSTDILGTFHYRHCSFAAALFIFILYCNFMGIFPFIEEPTANLNTTFALAITAFFYTASQSIAHHGIKKYVLHYFSPFVLMFPLNIIEKCSGIISISFRLFGNLMGGSVIMNLFTALVCAKPTAWYKVIITIVGPFLGILVYSFFGIFEGLIQAFVFTMLSLTYLSMELNHGEE